MRLVGLISKIQFGMVAVLFYSGILCAIFMTGIFFDQYIAAKWLFSTLLLCMLSAALTFCSRCTIESLRVKLRSCNPYFFTVVATIVGITAVVQIYITKSWHSPDLPIVTFDNVAGVVSCLVPISPFLLCLGKRGKKVIALLSLFFVAFVLISLKSRTGVISLATVTVLYFLLDMSRQRNHRRVAIVCTVVVLFLSFSFLSIPLKQESATGRQLIWLVSSDMVCKCPIFGYGIGGFERNYMNFQAAYFQRHPDSPFLFLADNVRTPFNEYIHILVNFGVIGLICLLTVVALTVWAYYKSRSPVKNVYVCSLSGIAMVACFSYPLLYPFTYIMALVSIVGLLPYDLFHHVRDRFRVYAGIWVLVLSIASLGYVARRIYYEYELKLYSESKPCDEAIIRNAPFYILNQADILYQQGKPLAAAEMIKKCLSENADYDMNLDLGRIYLELNDWRVAEKYLTKAHYMCPSRFYPLYYLTIAMREQHREKEVRSLCMKIINMPIKVYSFDVMMIRREAKKQLKQCTHVMPLLR